MDMSGQQRISSSREVVWSALNDAEILRRCIPGCQELIKESDTAMTAVAVVKVGPISARFQGRVTLSDLDPPNGYKISGEGQGGVAGHAAGSAIVRLTDDGDGTLLTYEVSAQIGGKLAQLGGRMIDATARTMAAAFFRQFAAEIANAGGEDNEAAPAAASQAPMDRAKTPSALEPGGWTRPQSEHRWSYLLVGLLLGALGMLFLGPGGTENWKMFAAGPVLAVGLVGFLLGRLGTGSTTTIVIERDAAAPR